MHLHQLTVYNIAFIYPHVLCHAGGFTADNPFPPRYSPALMSPKAAFCVQGPVRPASPAGSGLIVMGGGQTLGAGARDTKRSSRH